MASAVRRALPALIVFDLDACLWTPEMFELDSAPTSYSASKGGVQAGSDTVRLFPGAASVLRRILTNEGGAFTGVKVAVASSTTEPSYAQRCLEQLPIFEDGSRAEKVNDMVDYRQIYPGSKGRQHFPAYDPACSQERAHGNRESPGHYHEAHSDHGTPAAPVASLDG